MISEPYSSYYCLLIHIVSKGVKQLKILPPIQVEYLRSAGAKILKFILFPAIVLMLVHILSAILGNKVFPPISKIFSNKVFFTSVSI